MTFVVIITALIATLPGVELSWQASLIPVLNIALATKEIIARTINMLQYATLFSSLVILALLAGYVSYK